MSQLLGVILLLSAGIGSLAAFLATLTLLMPGITGRTQHALETMPGRSFVIGLVNFIFFTVIAALISIVGNQLPAPLRGLFNLAALFIVLAQLALSGVGLAAMVTLLRGRLKSAAPSLATTLWTSVLLLAAALAPVVGWFILTPLALIISLGAAIIALAQRPRNPGEG